MRVRNILIISLLCAMIPGGALFSAEDDALTLLRAFNNPPPQYTAVPFWSWNGSLEPDKLRWQVQEMIDKGIYGAFMHARAGIDYSKTPYFSEGWWDAVEAVLDEGKKSGFYPHLYDEDKWPSGSAGGRTRAADSLANSKKALRYEITELEPGMEIPLAITDNVESVVAVRRGENGELDPESLTDLTSHSEGTWKVPREGSWQLWTFTRHIEEDGINYLRRETVRTFMEITHEEYYRRFGNYFGTTIPGMFFDEISAGPHNSDLVWTDDFLSEFREAKGYDLRKYLPVLFADAGPETPVIRCDYYDVYTELYVDSWFRQISEWCGERGIFLTGHTYEDVNSYMSQGDYIRTWGPVQVPGTDNEDFRYTFPRKIGWFKPKQISGIAHTTGKRRIMGEILGGAGWGITPEELRSGVGMLGAYGLNFFVPHLFHYSMDAPHSMDDWPNSWFFRNPYWKYFKPLADYMSRVSYMNSQGRHVSDIAILFPITSQWASGVTVRRTNIDPGGGAYGGRLQDDYLSIQESLLRDFRDFDVLHPDYFVKAAVNGRKIKAGDGSYSVLILPPLTTIRRDVLAQLREFFYHGGIVIAEGQLPTDSREGGKNDPEVLKVMWEIFRVNPQTIRNGYDETMPDLSGEYVVNSYPSPEHALKNRNSPVGLAFFTKKIYTVPEILSIVLSPDITVSEGNKSALLFHHRRVGTLDIYNVMNGSKNRESYLLTFNAAGSPELWNPATGGSTPAPGFISCPGERTKMALSMEPWENCYVVFRRDGNDGKNPGITVTKTNIEELSVERNSSGGAVISGLLSGEEDEWYVSGNNGIRDIRSGGKIPSGAETVKLEGGWTFLPVPGELDYKWTPDVQSSILELPVMDFRIERVADEGMYYGWAVRGDDGGGWKQVKIFDSLHPDKGCSRYASRWDAHWISYYDYRQYPGDPGFGSSSILYFKKQIKVDDAVARGWVSLAADGEYTFVFNREALCSGTGYENARMTDITRTLKPGINELRIEVRKIGEESGVDFPRGVFLFEGEILCASGKRIELFSDETWQVSRDGVNWQPAFSVSYPPMGDYGDPYRGGERLAFPVVLWYRQALPPGAAFLEKSDVRGNYDLYINGKEIPKPASQPLDIRQYCTGRGDILAVRVRARSGKDGIVKPLSVRVFPVEMPLGDWSASGLGWYSGRAVYTRTFDLPETGGVEKWVLDSGNINHAGEIWINGRLAFQSPWPPFACDATDFLVKGENTITIIAANLLANNMRWNVFDDAAANSRSIWWHKGSILREPGKLVSGLLGPVRLIPYRKITVRVPGDS